MRGKLACQLLMAAAIALPAVGQIEDTEPPKLTGLSFAPNPIDVTGGPRTLTVDFTVTDNLSGATQVWASLQSPSLRQFIYMPYLATRISGTPRNGLWRGTVEVPQFSEAGVWKLEVYLWDAVTNRVTLDAGALMALSLPSTLTVVSIPDLQAPRVTGISIAPAAIDVSSAPQNVTVDLTLADDVSGVGVPGLTLASPARRQRSAPFFGFTLVSGTALNGTWRVTVTIPRYSEPGQWVIESLYLVDVANNRAYFDTSRLQALGLPATFNVSSSPADTAAPQLTGFSFTPLAIDTSSGPQIVKVQFQITDDRSGASFSNYFRFSSQFSSPSGAQFHSFEPNVLSAGTPLAGTWEASVFFPQYSEAGTWSVVQVGLGDAANNQLVLSTADLNALGFPTDLVVIRPSLQSDGTVGSAGGTILDQSFGARASVTIPPGAVAANTTVAIDVLTTPPAIPTPAGFSTGTFFTNINLSPAAAMPFPAPGLTLVLPLASFKAPGTAIQLFRLDPVTGVLVPAVNVSGGGVFGRVSADGLSASFGGVSRLSTVVGFVVIAVLGDANGDGRVDCADMAIVRASFGKRTGQPGFDARADLNRDGVVNIVDLSLVSRQLPAQTVCPSI